MTDLIVDACSLYARSWFAASKIEPDPVGTLRIALCTILSILDLNSDKLGVPIDRTLFCWDGPHKKEKHREPKPSLYYETLADVRDAFTSMLNTQHTIPDRYEGDDAVATAVFRSESDAVYIISGDKDLTQLVGGKVRYYCLNEKAVLSHPFITQKWRVKQPNQVAIALAIIGDKIDNVPGIHGWGPKKVQKLFQQVTPDMTFDQALETIDAQIPDDLKEAFYGSLEAIMLDPNVPDIAEPQQLIFAETDVMEAFDLPDFMPIFNRTVRSYYVHTNGNGDDYYE